MSLLARIEKQNQKEANKNESKGGVKTNPYWELKTRIHHALIKELDPILLQTEKSENHLELKRVIEEITNRFLEQDALSITRAEVQKITGEILNEVLGLGPIEPLLKDPTVSEVMVNSPGQVYVERKGRLELTSVSFRDDSHIMHIIEKIVAPIGRRIDESMPMVDARLLDGSRVNAIIPPLALKGPCLTIRKFSQDPLTVDDIVKFGTLTPAMAAFLEACVKARLNIIISGGTGSGKTSTLNILSSFIPDDERIVTVEDAAELQLRQEHVVSLETRPPNIEGKGAIAIRDLVRNCLRMRPDRIVVGECRGGEALDMLQAMNTGHDGSLTTAHANSPRDLLARLETMVLMAGMDLPVRAIREQIASAVDLVLQQNRLKDGSRKITHLTEVQGMEGDVITLQDIFVFQQKGLEEKGKIIGQFRPTGIRPKFMDRLEAAGIELPADTFGSF